jgi:hypothetical protein
MVVTKADIIDFNQIGSSHCLQIAAGSDNNPVV